MSCAGGWGGAPMIIRNFCFIISLLVSLVLIAGCTNTDIPTLPATSAQTLPSDLTGIRTPDVSITRLQPAAAIPVATTPAPVNIFNGEYHWAEYRINNTITLPPNPRYQWEYAARIERSYEQYNGIPAIHEKITITGDDSGWKDGKLITTKNGFHATENTYFERSTKRFLGGIYTLSGAGLDNHKETVPADDVYREDHNRGWLLISPFEEMNNPLSFQGLEPVTVPAGTYHDARRYSGNFHNLPGFPVTFWISEGAPVPVQYRINNPDLGGEDPVQTFELKAWG